MPSKILFLTLRIFSVTGGIEKVCRVAGKALYELGLQYGGSVQIFEMYGGQEEPNNRYFPQTSFTGFANKRVKFVLKSIQAGRQSDIVLLSHINLLVPGILIKLLKPSVKLVLIAHGIEVWNPLASWKRYLLNKVDLFIPVSHFTKDQMKALHRLPEDKFRVINNCLDPFLEQPLQKGKAGFLLQRYGLQEEHTILLTVTRMADAEQYKGYDRVLEALPQLVAQYPNLRYLLVGKYDAAEKQRIDAIIGSLGLQDTVIFTGFVADEELSLHFTLGDIFVMPSEKEGFGIVFIEAMFYGLPVIAGNADGSTDALCNGELGLLVDPADIPAIAGAIKKMLDDRTAYLPDEEKLQSHFGYRGYKQQLHTCMETLLNS